MPLPVDPAATFRTYAHPERLVTTQWLEDNLGAPGLVVLESNEDVLLFHTGHLPGAQKIDWHLDLNDPTTRDYVSPEGFAAMCSARGISRDTTVVIYGDNFNWWASYALWVFSLFGHEDVRLVDGGRAKWVAEGRTMTTDVEPVTPSEYPIVPRDDTSIRAFKEDVLAQIGNGPLVDVRSPGEFSGELLHMPDYPQEGAQRGGHVPTAKSVPWKRAANDDGSFKSADELRAIYGEEQGLQDDDAVITYCRIGERSSHTWFVLTHLLGFENVRNYDGSWVEWGNAVRVPIENPSA